MIVVTKPRINHVREHYNVWLSPSKTHHWDLTQGLTNSNPSYFGKEIVGLQQGVRLKPQHVRYLRAHGEKIPTFDMEVKVSKVVHT